MRGGGFKDGETGEGGSDQDAAGHGGLLGRPNPFRFLCLISPLAMQSMLRFANDTKESSKLARFGPWLLGLVGPLQLGWVAGFWDDFVYFGFGAVGLGVMLATATYVYRDGLSSAFTSRSRP